MPSTLQYRPILIDNLVTQPRIRSYERVFAPRTDVELMGVYLWNSHVCGAICPLISQVEVSLRNAIDRALTLHLGEFWWSGIKLRHRSFTPNDGASVPKSVEIVRRNFSNASNQFRLEQLRRHHRKSVALDHHGVLAKAEFSTWCQILDDEFMGDRLIWPSRLRMVFAGDWGKRNPTLLLRHARNLANTIREFRNRVFHHEPAWKGFGVRTPQDAIIHLREKIDRIVALMALIHPEVLRAMEINGLLRAALRVCSFDEIKRFQHSIDAAPIADLDELRILVAECISTNRATTVHMAPYSEARFSITPV